MKLETLDISIFIAYVLGLLILALWISREEKGANKNTEDYFLASKALPWWAIGASLIASNISAEQIRPGMAANAEFTFKDYSAEEKSKMTVPVEAVGKDNEGNFVFVLNKRSDGVHIAEKKIINIGKLMQEGFELISGLEGGEIVATAGLKSLMNGSEVKLLNDSKLDK